MASQKPVLVVVPGSCAPAALYDVFADHVRFNGFEAEIVSLPSVGRKEGVPPATMADDAAHIAGVIRAHTDKKKCVVVVTHSYGGVPATESLKGLTAKDLGPGKGGVTHLVYATAMAFVVGGSIASLAGEGEQPVLDYVEYTTDGYVRLTDYAKGGASNLNTMAPDEQVEQAKRLTYHSVMSFTGSLSHAGYLDVPITYLLATEDKVIPPATQEKFVKGLKDAGADVTVVKFHSDHGWFASSPRSTARKVLQAIDPSL